MPLYLWDNKLLRVGNALAANELCCCKASSSSSASACDALLITYDWSETSSRDLDTGTLFLGTKVGWSCGNGNAYITWGGDNTGSNATETVTVYFRNALNAGLWTNVTSVTLYAGWYSPAGGSGPARVRARCLSGGPEQSISISPGSQNNCASTYVGQITIWKNGVFFFSG